MNANKHLEDFASTVNRALGRAITQGWTLMAMTPVRADGAQAPGAVTLCQVRSGEWAVHFFNGQDGGFHNGNYLQNLTTAREVFAEKSERFTRHHFNGLQK